MQHFELHINQFLQGNFDLKRINLAFVFQVNCPGCFMYGIPIVNDLFDKYSNKIGIIGISTCFEDFAFNTEENTIKFLRNGELVGETKKYFAQSSIEVYPQPIRFAVAFDEVIPPNEIYTNDFVESISKQHPNYAIWTQWEKESVRDKIMGYYSKYKYIAKTFAINQLNGTPSFIIFDEKRLIRKNLFGHHSAIEISETIDNLLNT